MNFNVDQVDSQINIVPESPPMSQIQTESQSDLLSKLAKSDDDEECYIIEDSCSQKGWTKPDDKEGTATNDEVLIEDYDDDPKDACLRQSTDFIIDVEMEDDDDDISFLHDVERLEQEAMLVSEPGPSRSMETNDRLGWTIPSKTSDADFNLNAQRAQMQRTDDERLQDVRNMKRLDPSERIFPDVKSNSFHTLAFFLPTDYKLGDDLLPNPPTFQSKWENEFVPMPCAKQNTRIVKVRRQVDASQTNTGGDDDRSRFREERVLVWSRIEKAINFPILSCSDFENTLRQYITFRSELKTLKHCVETVMTRNQRDKFFAEVLPCIQTLCLDLENIVTCPLPLLKQHKNQSISLSQKQIACLLANAFFCTFPKRFGDDEAHYPSINFLELFQCQEDDDDNSTLAMKTNKLLCVLHYFEKISDKMPMGVVTFTRRSLRHSVAPKWDTLQKPLTKIVPLLDGTIEDDGAGMLQVDFANKFLGGGFMGRGAVQEEILFSIYPELIISRLFTETLTSSEALLVTGCERFSKYSGYSSSFQFEGDFTDSTPIDAKGRRCAQFVAIDALYITRPATQFQPKYLSRELNKAYIGFSSPTSVTSVPVATGKWGCGAFRGNPQLKAILQLLAASHAGRDVVFFTFGDLKIQKEIEEMYETIRNCNIQQVWKLLCQYNSLFCATSKQKWDLCEYFVRFANNDSVQIPEDYKPGGSLKANKIGKLKEVPITHFYTRDSSASTSRNPFYNDETEEYVTPLEMDSEDSTLQSRRPIFSKSARREEISKLPKNKILSETEIIEYLQSDDNSQQSQQPNIYSTSTSPIYHAPDDEDNQTTTNGHEVEPLNTRREVGSTKETPTFKFVNKTPIPIESSNSPPRSSVKSETKRLSLYDFYQNT